MNSNDAQWLARALQQETVRWVRRLLDSSHAFAQSLTTLNLYNNQIGDRGAHYLGIALQHNKVGSTGSHVAVLFDVDANHTEPLVQFDRFYWSKAHGWGIEEQ